MYRRESAIARPVIATAVIVIIVIAAFGAYDVLSSSKSSPSTSMS